MHNRKDDWKDVADSYFDKALSLAVLVVLFSFLVSPKITVKPYEAKAVLSVEAIEIPPEIKEKIQPPTQAAKPIIEIIVDDDLEGEEDEDIEIIETIESTKLEDLPVAPPPSVGKTPKFVVFEDPPIPTRRISPKYPDFAKRAGIQGKVILSVEVLIDGRVGAVEIIKSLEPSLDQAAIDAVKQWEFQPAKSQGNPVACWANIPLSFSLND